MCEVLAKQKSSTLQKLEIGTLIKLRSDNDTEYTNKTFEHFCTNNKIKRGHTVPETPEQYGMAERYNPKVVESARCLPI